jgi:hypothetical protein
MRRIIPISGKDSLATAIIQRTRQPALSYEYFYNPTGMDLPEVDVWLALVESYLGASIHRVGDDLETIMYEQKILPAHKTRYCTRLAKIFPMEEWIGKEQAMVYYGIRADERRVGYQSITGGNITPVYPLKEEGYTLPMVWDLVSSLDLLPPPIFLARDVRHGGKASGSGGGYPALGVQTVGTECALCVADAPKLLLMFLSKIVRTRRAARTSPRSLLAYRGD